MSALIIPFPAERFYRSQDLIEAISALEVIADHLASGDPIKIAVAEAMLPFWEERRAVAGGAAGTVH